jgi:serine/threonine protein kinase
MIITELCDYGSVADVISQFKRMTAPKPTLLASPEKKAMYQQHLDWKGRVKIALDAAKGMLYLHSKDLLHCDLKSLNLLIDSSWTCKVADFGLSRHALLPFVRFWFSMVPSAGRTGPQALSHAMRSWHPPGRCRYYIPGMVTMITPCLHLPLVQFAIKIWTGWQWQTIASSFSCFSVYCHCIPVASTRVTVVAVSASVTFGAVQFCRYLSGKQGMRNVPAVNNPMWQAPEVIADPHQCSKQGDVYSYGIVLWELMMMTSPWLGIQLPIISQLVQVRFVIYIDSRGSECFACAGGQYFVCQCFCKA